MKAVKKRLSRLMSFLVVLAMLMASVSTDYVKAAAETEENVLAEITEGIGVAKDVTVVKNGDYDEYIAEDDLAIPDEIKKRNSMQDVKIAVNVTVSSYTGSGSPTVCLCAMAYDWSGYDTGDTVNAVEVGKTYDLSLDLSAYENEDGSTLGVVRVRLQGNDGDAFNYTINSVKITGPADSEPKEQEELTFPVSLKAGNGSVGTATGGIIKKNPYGEDYNCDTHFNIPKAFTEGLGGYQDLKLHVTGTVTKYTPDENETPIVYIYGMDSTYGNWNQVNQVLTETPQAFDLTLDMLPYMWQGTLGEIGLKVSGCVDGTEVEWNIESAQLEGSGQQGEVESLRLPAVVRQASSHLLLRRKRAL